MGTSLTGLTPATTYDALIKVGDNGPLSATAKYLSDGLGNDSAMSLSTVSVGIGTATPSGNLHIESANPNSNLIASSGNAVFRLANSATSATRKELTTILDTTNNRVEIQAIQQGVATLPICINASGGNVGIGTTAPQFKLEVSGVVGGYESGGIALKTYTKIAGFQLSSYQSVNGAPYTKTTDLVANADSGVASELRVLVASSGSNPAEIARFTTNGLTFNGDTAAANALDDYEEGTFTPTIAGSTTAGTATYSVQNARYTKIGRQVSCQIDLAFSGGTGTGDLQISGLPFTESQNATNPAGSIGFFDAINLTALNFPMVIVPSGTARMDFYQGPVGGGGLSPITYDGAGRIIVSVVYLGS